MDNFIKKLITVNQIEKEVNTYECWSVEWKTHEDTGISRTTTKKEFFTKKEDAQTFHDSLVQAGKILKYRGLEVEPIYKEINIMNSCGVCKYFEKAQAKGVGYMGNCVRYPPAIENRVKNLPDYFPRVFSYYCVCGEFKKGKPISK